MRFGNKVKLTSKRVAALEEVQVHVRSREWERSITWQWQLGQLSPTCLTRESDNCPYSQAVVLLLYIYIYFSCIWTVREGWEAETGAECLCFCAWEPAHSYTCLSFSFILSPSGPHTYLGTTSNEVSLPPSCPLISFPKCYPYSSYYYYPFLNQLARLFI